MSRARIQFARGTAAFWESENPILRPGEPGYERDTRKWKVGDGVTPWNDLAYMASSTGGDDSAAMEALNEHISDPTPHSVYDDGPSLYLLYQNAKV